MADNIEKLEIDEDASEATVVKAELSALVSDFKHLAAAELEYLKVRAAYSGRLAKWISIYVTLALFGALSTLIALVVGSLLILSQYIGIIWASLIVVAAFVLLTLICAQMARSHAAKLTFTKDVEDE